VIPVGPSEWAFAACMIVAGGMVGFFSGGRRGEWAATLAVALALFVLTMAVMGARHGA
jgi:hypothetical protein